MKTPHIILAFMLTISMNSQAENKQKAIDSIQSLLKTSKQDTCRVSLLNKLSEKFIENDDYKSAIASGEESIILAQRLRFTYGESAASRFIGIANTCNGQYAIALNNLFHALKLAEDIKNDYLIGKIYNSIGTNYSIQNEYGTSLNYLFKSLSFYYNPVVYEDIARSYHQQGRDVLANEFYRKALSSDIPEIEKSNIFNDLGDIQECHNNLDSAMAYYFKSLKIATELHNDATIGDASGSIGDLYLKQGKFKKAIYYENKSLEIDKKINSRWGIVQASKALSEIYETIGDEKKSLYFYKNYISVRDSIYSEENTKLTIRAEMSFNFNKKQAEQKAEQDKKDAIASQEKHEQAVITYSISAGLMLVMIFSLFIFRSLNITKKQKNIIELQKNEVLRQKEIVDKQKKIIEEKSKETTDNITYAKRIQDATMPSISRVKDLFPSSFILNRGKDIVSGDFYFVEKVLEDKIIFAVADSTSHGVSGSMMSILNSNLLSEAVRNGIHTPSKILDYVNTAIARSFHQTGKDKEVKDGMDISICSLDTKSLALEFAGAYNPLIIVRNKELIELEADKLQLGQAKQNYTNHEFNMQFGDMIYLSSDGFADQFGGDKNKKYKYKNFTSLLCKISDMSSIEQYHSISNEFDCWKGDFEQTDDVLVMGIQI